MLNNYVIKHQKKKKTIFISTNFHTFQNSMPLKICKTYMTQAIIHNHNVTIGILNLNVSMKFRFVVHIKKVTNKETARIHKF
jgi:hypothetical protein